MAKLLKLNIGETTQDLLTLLNQPQYANNKEVVVALYLFKIGKVKTLKHLSQTIGRNPATLRRWFQTYELQGLNALLHLKKS